MANFQTNESAFNAAVEYLKINIMLLKVSSEYQTEKRLRDWFEIMRTVYGRFRIKFGEKEREEIIGIKDQIKEYFKKYPGIDEEYKQCNINGKSMSKLNMPDERDELYELIDLYTDKILTYADKKGMLLPSKSDPRFAVLNR